MNRADIIAFGTHPDDAEIGCGGTMIKLADAGHKVVIVDLVRGEMGTRGSAEIRAQEAAASSKILGLHGRENLELQDGNIDITMETKREVVEAIRRWRPKAIFLPYWEDRHPDHSNASRLIYEATFLSGLLRFDTGQEAYRPTQLFYYMGWYEFTPTFVVDITEQADRKLEAIYAFGTQFRPDTERGPQTRLISPTTDWFLRSRMAQLGSRIHCKFGEGFLIRGHLEVENPLDLMFESF
ncbi:bacillithiol biosynthesis deacetylase BshB1 [Candidatus Bipolaricaulota bacterium]|nr:bacillithiol biosynthesis deacetylase BshB1 [Candidatus Bipolaricaulota bacterium]